MTTEQIIDLWNASRPKPAVHSCTVEGIETPLLGHAYCGYCGAYYGTSADFDDDAPLAAQRIALPEID